MATRDDTALRPPSAATARALPWWLRPLGLEERLVSASAPLAAALALTATRPRAALVAFALGALPQLATLGAGPRTTLVACGAWALVLSVPTRGGLRVEGPLAAVWVASVTALVLALASLVLAYARGVSRRRWLARVRTGAEPEWTFENPAADAVVRHALTGNGAYRRGGVARVARVEVSARAAGRAFAAGLARTALALGAGLFLSRALATSPAATDAVPLPAPLPADLSSHRAPTPPSLAPAPGPADARPDPGGPVLEFAQCDARVEAGGLGGPDYAVTRRGHYVQTNHADTDESPLSDGTRERGQLPAAVTDRLFELLARAPVEPVPLPAALAGADPRAAREPLCAAIHAAGERPRPGDTRGSRVAVRYADGTVRTLGPAWTAAEFDFTEAVRRSIGEASLESQRSRGLERAPGGWVLSLQVREPPAPTRAPMRSSLTFTSTGGWACTSYGDVTGRFIEYRSGTVSAADAVALRAFGLWNLSPAWTPRHPVGRGAPAGASRTLYEASLQSAGGGLLWWHDADELAARLRPLVARLSPHCAI